VSKKKKKRYKVFVPFFYYCIMSLLAEDEDDAAERAVELCKHHIGDESEPVLDDKRSIEVQPDDENWE
jgi:hypothetical protein